MNRHHRRDPFNYPRDARHAFHMRETDYQRVVQRGRGARAPGDGHLPLPRQRRGAYFSELDQEFASQPLFPFPDAVPRGGLGDGRGGHHARRDRGRRPSATWPRRPASRAGRGPGGGSVRPVRRLARGGCAAARCPAASGSGSTSSDLPDVPLAIVYRTRDESERRVELLQRSKRVGAPARELGQLRRELPAPRGRRGRCSASAAAGGEGRRPARAHGGGRRAGTSRCEPFEFAFRGDRPLDWSRGSQRGCCSRASAADPCSSTSGTDERATCARSRSGPADHPTGCYLPDGRIALGLVRASQVPSGETTKKVSRICLSGAGRRERRGRSPRGRPTRSPSLLARRHAGSSTRPSTPNGRPTLVASPPTDGVRRRAVIAHGPRRRPSRPTARSWSTARRRAPAGASAQMHPDGQAKRPLGGGSRDENDPRVSPDGRFVVYVYDDEGTAAAAGADASTAGRTGR